MAKCCIENDVFSPKMRLLCDFYDTSRHILRKVSLPATANISIRYNDAEHQK